MPGPAASNRYDAVVVGARCAGAATAMLLARRGARVLVVDHDMPGTDTMSTHALMRGAVMQLHRWGVLDRIRATDVQPIRRTSFFYGTEVLDMEIVPALGTDALLAPRRTVIDAVLVDAARAAGASFRFETGCTGLVTGGTGRVAGVRLRNRNGTSEVVHCDMVIGADGRRSAVARHVAAPILRRSANASAVVYGYFDGLPNFGYRWFWDKRIAGGIIPTNGDQSCVFIAMPPADFDDRLRGRGFDGFMETMTKHLPAMHAAMAGARLTGHLIAFRGEPGYVRASVGPGWALVGDAGYFKDPITAHGITDALRDAEILADAIAAGRPGTHPEIRDALCGTFFRLTDRIAGYGWSFEELKELHIDLSRAMKTSQTWMAENLPALPRAA